MSGKILASILLAAGVATSKPINSPYILGFRQDALPIANACANSGSSVILALNALESRAREELIQIETNRPAANADLSNAEIADTQQLILQQVNQALLADHQANAANNEMDNVLRAVALSQQEPAKSIVLLVVQEVEVSVELRGQANARMFKQEAIVANRGKQETDTIMVYDPRTLTANPAATVIANASLPNEVVASKTIAAVLYNAKPTYAQVIEDPAASMRKAIEGALQDRQKYELRLKDGEMSREIALMIEEEAEEKKQNNDNGEDSDKAEEQELDKERKKQQEAEQQELDQTHEQERENKKNAEKELEEQKKQAEEQAKEKTQLAEQEAKDKNRAEKEAERKKQLAEQEAEKEKQLAEQEAEREKQKMENDAEQQKQMEKETEKKAEEEKQKAKDEAAEEEKKAEQQQREHEKEQAEQQAKKEKQQAKEEVAKEKQQAEADAGHDAQAAE